MLLPLYRHRRRARILERPHPTAVLLVYVLHLLLHDAGHATAGGVALAVSNSAARWILLIVEVLELLLDAFA